MTGSSGRVDGEPELRWIPEADRDLIRQWWRISRAHSHSAWERLTYLARSYHRRNPAVSTTAAYKDIAALVAYWWRGQREE